MTFFQISTSKLIQSTFLCHPSCLAHVSTGLCYVQLNISPLWVLVPSKLFQYRMAESSLSVLAFYCSPVTSLHLSHITFVFNLSVSSPLSVWITLSTRRQTGSSVVGRVRCTSDLCLHWQCCHCCRHSWKWYWTTIYLTNTACCDVTSYSLLEYVCKSMSCWSHAFS